MRIKRLDIQGFKSFADPIAINFDEGITGVVGPNGCGKSNIVDALRWVMGEQNAKHLRGGVMQDIIFNGAQGRGPSGLAEVSLTLDNVNPEQMPEEYAAFSEIQVTRRLYRTGDSEYEINKHGCRLKDITELFLGTGVGTKAYSIIEQGQVAKLISSKPEDRRHIVEEAAGITKYKAKRLAAERRMATTTQNLERVDDIKRELESRLGGLERQAKKAKKFQHLKVELKNLDLHHATLNFFEHQASLNFFKNKAQNLENSIGDISELTKESEDFISSERDVLALAEKDLSLLQASLYEVNNAIALAKKDISYVTETSNTSQERTAQIHDELTKLHEKQNFLIDEFRKTKEEQTKYVDRLKVNREKLQKEEAHFHEAQGLRNEAYDNLERIRKEHTSTTANTAKNQANLESFKKEKNSLQTRSQAILEDLENFGTEEKENHDILEVLRADTETNKSDKSELKNSLDNAQNKLNQVGSELKDYYSQKNSTRENLSKTKGKLSSLKEIENSQSGSSEVIGRLKKSDNFKNSQLVSELIKAPREIEEALENALTPYLETLLAGPAASSKSFISEVKKQKDGRASLFLDNSSGPTSLSSMFVAADCESLLSKLEITPEYKTQINSLLSGWYLVGSLEAGFSAWDKAKSKNIYLLTPEGDTFCPDGILKVGSSQSSSGVLKRKRLIEELEQEKTNLENRFSELEIKITKLENSKQESKALCEDFKNKLKSVDYSLVHLTAKLSNIESNVKKLAQRKESLSAEKERNLTNFSNLEQQEIQIKSDLEDSKTKIVELESAVLEKQNKLKDIEQNFAKHNASLSSIKALVGHEQERQDFLDKNIRRIENEQADVRNRLELLEQQKIDLSSKLVELAEKKDAAQDKINLSQVEQDKINTLLNSKKEIYDQKLEKLKEKENAISDKRLTLDEQRTELNNLNLKMQEHELAITSIDERLTELYKQPLFDIINDYHFLEKPEKDLHKEIVAMQKALDNMGNINLNAQEEYDELSERFDFLEKQSSDLASALDQLTSAINKINATTITRFKEAFDAINTSFTKVFPRLFKGGSAWLALTDPSDLLNSGVEIFAQPPGKKLASIALMSGGEKALTATSLIFAIFLIKPSPFCLLDEVDAPLDESNVARFSDIVKEMSARSQFILITHNKRTMEVIDHLYGITMEQPGVSKTVHVHVNETVENSLENKVEENRLESKSFDELIGKEA